MHTGSTCQNHKTVNYKRDSHGTINCDSEQEQQLGSSVFHSLNRGRGTVVALIDFCLSSDTMNCQLTGNANIDEVAVGCITSAITTEVRSWSFLHLHNSLRERCYVPLTIAKTCCLNW